MTFELTDNMHVVMPDAPNKITLAQFRRILSYEAKVGKSGKDPDVLRLVSILSNQKYQDLYKLEGYDAEEFNLMLAHTGYLASSQDITHGYSIAYGGQVVDMPFEFNPVTACYVDMLNQAKEVGEEASMTTNVKACENMLKMYLHYLVNGAAYDGEKALKASISNVPYFDVLGWGTFFLKVFSGTSPKKAKKPGLARKILKNMSRVLTR